MLAAMWSLFSGLHILASDIEDKILLSDLKFVFIASLPVTWILLAATFTGLRVSLKTVALLFVIPLITVGLIATNSLHHIVFLESVPLVRETFVSVSREYGLWFWVHTFYSYVLLAIGMGMFVRFIFKSQGDLRGQAIIMTAGSLVPVACNALYLSNPEAFSHLDLTPISFSISGVVFFLGLFKYRMLDFMPIAREEIIRSMADGVVVTDTLGRIVETNDAVVALLSDAHETAIDRDISSVFPFLKDVWENAQSREKCQTEVRFDEVDAEDTGKERWFVVVTKMVHDSAREHQGFLVLLRDVTERKMAEVKMQESVQRTEELSNLKSAFLSNMSHDVRTPLSGIIGLADVLIEECEDEQKELAELIRTSSDRLLKLLNSILSVAHLSSGTLDQNTERTNVNDLSLKIISQFEKEIEAKHLEFRVSVPTTPIASELDPNHLAHAMSHLLDQSLRFTESGSIQFDLRQELSNIVIRITDTGRGFESNFIASIHQSLDNMTLAEFGLDKSSGLGLRVAHGFIEEMGGNLDIHSEMGTGTTFTIRLPIFESKANKSSPAHSDRGSVSHARGTQSPTREAIPER